MTSKKEHAVALAEQGFRIFPLAPNGKTPALDSNWRVIASKDPARVAEMWTCPITDAEHDFNIGIALTSDVLVFDEDTSNGKQGAKSRALLEAIYEELPSTLTVRSASGGKHRYYGTHLPVGNSASKVGQHIDIKSEGGFAVGPGSSIDGVEYVVENAAPIAPAPEFLLTLAGKPRARVMADTATPLVDLDGQDAISRATEYLTTKAPDNGTYGIAAKVKDFGVSQDKCLELMLEHWRDARSLDKDDSHIEFRVNNAYRYGQNAPGISAAEAEFDAVEVADTVGSGIRLNWIAPFKATDIPKRQFVLGTFAAKQYLTGLISPPGVGKTTFLLMCAVAVASGRDDITGFKVHERTKVLLWNQEDETDELKRRLLAVMTAFDVKWSDIEINGEPGIVLGSGVDKALMFATRSNDTIVMSRDAKAIEEFMLANGIGLGIFDPFVEMHPADENNNVEVAAVARVFRRVAVRANCSVILAHHTRKPPAASGSDAYAGNMDSGRGAGALNGVARMVATLYTLDAATAKKYGIREAEIRNYIRFDDAKSNLSLVSGDPIFFKREGVTIGGFGGEEVGVLRPASLSRVKDVKEQAKDDLVGDVFECMGAHDKIPVTEMARVLCGLPMRADDNPRAVEMAIKRTFDKPVKLNNHDIRITTAGKRVILERRENKPESCNSNSATETNATVATEEKNQ